MTRSSETGSSTTTPALAMASLNPSEPAILKLISEESTGWYLPSKHSTRTSTTGKPCTPPVRHRLLDALLHGRDELAGDGAADDLVDELEARHPARSGSTRSQATPNWPWPPVCFLYLPSASAGRADRLPVGDADLLGVDVHAELARQPLERDGQVRLAHAPSSVWWVSSLRSTTSAGSSAWRRCSDDASLSSSAWVRGLTAMLSTARRRLAGGDRDRRALRRQRVAGVRVGQLGDGAEVAGARRSVVGVCSLPRSSNRPCSRSVAAACGG